ncbi:MAG: bifunctional oligoribonuclease/PAP phosphatase NrnA [Lachnospiraceae bacterium]|nr:bifunctional oligoribonuclease/PAP phosphatase NrnA [Lachnospiraceae bacterium]
MTELLDEIAKGAKTIAIAGHVHPDGDCVGSVLGCALYLKAVLPSEVSVHAYLENISESFSMLSGLSEIDTEFQIPDEPYDLFISVDCGSSDRLGRCENAFHAAKKTVSFDHHITNTEFADRNFVDASASSTCEVLFAHMRRAAIDLPIAEALYTGILHDTGVFKYSSTSEKTMCTAGYLMSKGIDTATLVDRSFYMKTYAQLKALGLALGKAELELGGKVIVAVLTLNDMKSINASHEDTGSIVSELRTTEGVEVAIFVREDMPGLYKFSLRSNGKVDVASISSGFGGGGHKLAAGFSAAGDLNEFLTQLYALIMLQL